MHLKFTMTLLMMSLYVVRPYISNRIMVRSSRFGNMRHLSSSRKNFNDDEIIDAEIVGEPKPSNNKPTRRKEEPPKQSSGGIFGLAKKGVKSIFNGLSSFVKEDEEKRLKRERTKEFNKEIDTIMKGTGILGGIAGSLFKSLNSVVVDTMQESSNNINLVQQKVSYILMNNRECQNILGSSISSYTPFSTSMSTTSINGATKKQIMLQYPVAGSKGEAQIDVQASFEGRNSVIIQRLVLVTRGGGRVNIPISGGGDGGSVIDAEIVK